MGEVPLCQLGAMASIGPDPRDVYDGFSLSKQKTAFPSFWGHKAFSVVTMAQQPNAYLSPLPKALPGRSLRKAETLWPRAGRVLLSQRPWLNTKSLSAVRLDTPVLCDVWWPLTLQQGGIEEEKALLEQMESRTGIKAVSGGTSVAEALRFMGAKKMSMYVPTNEEITQKTVHYFEDQGFEVCAYDSLYEEKLPDINRLSPQEIYGNVRKLYRRCPEVDGIFITGGCFRTLEILDILEKDTGVPMITTTPANMFRCLQVAGINDPIMGFGQLLEKDRLN